MQINEKVKVDFLNYANAVIKSRAITNVEDNLKPVHKRILYTMYDMKLFSNKNKVKCANIVGQIMSLHPHGDSSIYDALIRLSQPWKIRYPLIDIQGNKGSILGDSAAAMRYTEANLTIFGEKMLEDINKECVPFKDNYDGTKKEPVILPSLFPNILCNGNSGIAVGLSANLVPHNLNEVIDGIIAYLNNKSISTKELMKYIKGPDFPTGGTIIDSEKLEGIYETGNGTITIRSKYSIIDEGKNKAILITEIPFLVELESGVIEPLKKLVLEENFDLIEDYENITQNGKINLKIILKKNANVFKVLEVLFTKTRLQVTQKINNMVIKDGNPKLMNLKDLIIEYIEHRHKIITNISLYEVEKINKKLHILNGLIKALTDIDNIIILIKESENKSDARIKIMKTLIVDEIQADSILDMKLSRLSKIDKIDINKEIAELIQEKRKLEELINNEKTRENQIKMDLFNLKKLADLRRTVVAFTNYVEGEESSSQDLKIIVFKNGNVLPTQQKIEKIDFKKKYNIKSPVVSVIETNTNDELLIFTEEGKYYKQKILTLGIENIEDLSINGIVAALSVKNIQKYITFISSEGYCKRTESEEFISGKNGSTAIKLKEDNILIFAGDSNEQSNLFILNKESKVLKINISDIKLLSRATIGNKIYNGEILSCTIADNDDQILMINNKGQAKLTKVEDFSYTAIKSNGQVIAENTLIIKNQKNNYFIYYSNGKNNYVDSGGLSIKSKVSVGAKIINDVIESIST